MREPGPRRQRLDAGHPGWPTFWRDLPDPPREVTVTGDPGALALPLLAVVGTRNASPRGLVVARALAGALARAGWGVVSGLALGIDAAAHRGALDAGGTSVAVMGTGCDLTYPPRHRDLRRRIEDRGCCVTELPEGAPPLRHHFPLRNRLIAGIARGVIVVEAPLRSGALLTAQLALEYGREVLAVPGPVDSERSRGCHHLLKEGAALVESVEDVHRQLAPPLSGGGGDRAEAARWPLPAPGSPARWIWDRLDLDGVPLAGLRRRWGGTDGTWAEGLLALELAGLIRRLPGGGLARSIWSPYEFDRPGRPG